MGAKFGTNNIRGCVGGRPERLAANTKDNIRWGTKFYYSAVPLIIIHKNVSTYNFLLH